MSDFNGPIVVGEYVDVHWNIMDAIRDAEYRCKGQNVTFAYSREKMSEFVFFKGDYVDFFRSICNLLNNAADATVGREGLVEIRLAINGDKVEVRIKDNGEGMPKTTAIKIESGSGVDTTRARKDRSYGLGLIQVIKTAKEAKGKISVESEEGRGTEFILTFPRCETPFWFADKIEFRKGDVIVALDDYDGILDIWEERFRHFVGDIELKLFADGRETIDFINSMEDKGKALLLTDFDLRQDIDGVDVIEAVGLTRERSIIVTSVTRVRDFYTKRHDLFKMVAKDHIYELPLIMRE